MTDDAATDYPTRGALLGLDYGSKRIGVAVSNAEQTIASPLETVAARPPALAGARLRKLADDYRAVGLVVGLPVHMSGEEGGQARAARAFGRRCGEATGLPVRFCDERYTTAAADVHLMGADLTSKKQAARRDRVAAQVILQSYLDAPDRTRLPGPYGNRGEPGGGLPDADSI